MLNMAEVKGLELTVGFLGCGNMARAMLQGMLSVPTVRPDRVIASAAHQTTLDRVHRQFGVRTTLSNEEVVNESDVVIIAVKPYLVHKVLDQISTCVSPQRHLFISIASSIQCSDIEEWLPSDVRVIRTLPTLPISVCSGTLVYNLGSKASADDVGLMTSLFTGISTIEGIPESSMHAVTAAISAALLSTYVAIESTADGGVKVGMPRALSLKLAAQTMLGAAKLSMEKNPAILKDEMCSPGGVTIHGLHALEKGGFRSVLIDNVEAMDKRSHEMGDAK